MDGFFATLPIKYLFMHYLDRLTYSVSRLSLELLCFPYNIDYKVKLPSVEDEKTTVRSFTLSVYG